MKYLVRYQSAEHGTPREEEFNSQAAADEAVASLNRTAEMARTEWTLAPSVRAVSEDDQGG